MLSLILPLLMTPETGWQLEYARPESSTCAPSWNPSWAMWPNANTGGFVCVRDAPPIVKLTHRISALAGGK